MNEVYIDVCLALPEAHPSRELIPALLTEVGFSGFADDEADDGDLAGLGFADDWLMGQRLQLEVEWLDFLFEIAVEGFG